MERIQDQKFPIRNEKREKNDSLRCKKCGKRMNPIEMLLARSDHKCKNCFEKDHKKLLKSINFVTK